MKNPIFSSNRNLYHYLFVWAVITGAHTKTLYFFYDVAILPALTDGIIFNLLFAEMALGFWYAVKYQNIHSRNPLVVILNHVLTAVIFLAIWLTAGFYLVKILTSYDAHYQHFLDKSLPWRIITGVLYYLVTILVYYLYIYYSSFKEKQLKEAELNTLIKETELSLLKSQLNPHFIFNSLNSISSLTLTNPSLAQDMVIKLSSFLRYAMDQAKSQLIPFSEEVNNALLYLDIEKTRFGDRFILKKEIQEECHQVKLPNMILQPLLENAIKHGVYENTEPVTVHFTASLQNNFLHIKITNTFDPEAVIKKGKGIGLRNVRERLQLLFGKKDLLKISQSADLFEVNLYIPYTINS